MGYILSISFYAVIEASSLCFDEEDALKSKLGAMIDKDSLPIHKRM